MIMKQYILSLVLLFFFASCQEHKSEKQEQAIEDLTNTELTTGVKNDTIFLGLRFGMGGEDVHNYFYDLVSQGKLYLLPHKYFSYKRKIFIYKFDFGNEAPLLQNVQASFRSYYIKDKLYKLRISVESEKNSNLQLLKSKLIEIYILKYGHNYIKKENTFYDSDGYIWIDGNRKIEICEGFNNYVLIIYTDLIAVKEIEGTSRETIMREK